MKKKISIVLISVFIFLSLIAVIYLLVFNDFITKNLIGFILLPFPTAILLIEKLCCCLEKVLIFHLFHSVIELKSLPPL